MISVLIRNDRICSVLRCDICHQEIRKVEDGLLAMPKLNDWEGSPPESVEFSHVHKGACQRQFEAQSTGYGDLELRDHIFHLLGNIGWRPKHMAQAREFHALELIP